MKTLEDSSFDPQQMTVIMAHGFQQNLEYLTEHCELIREKDPNANILLIDWSQGARGPLPRYLHAASNVKLAADYAAMVFEKLIHSRREALSPESILQRTHGVGFSLGAHVIGWIGKCLQNSLKGKMSTIIGLDPAGLFFDGLLSFFRQLQRGDATFVSALQTDRRRCGANNLNVDMLSKCLKPDSNIG
ncbi:hypothetical protein BV898_04557 [Hypsibius exemplaris]|uniref:Lipase domain-containing protein n=1 Tax=Hypsibius exemplaris TaxID=2072580 RepID=A0A1W0X1M0_HYPEX|nr:hypothetical protein BV898_04557 [Hypsibius exemplaris]